MEPREKARELVDKMYYCQRYVDGENYIPLEAYKRAKQCALIVANEIINLLTDINSIYNINPAITYWKEVKQEIENL
jgi:hypothetical protein